MLEQLSTPHVSNLIKYVNPTPELIQAQKLKHHIEMLIGLASSVRVQIRACSNTLAGKVSTQNTVLH